MELDGLRYEGRREHRYEGLLSSIFPGMGEAKPYFERFGYPIHLMIHVAINSALPRNVGTGFAEVQEWEFEATCHPIIPAWFGRHFADAGWAPMSLLMFLVASGLLKTLKVREAIVFFGRQTEVWLPDGRDEACSVIGKFTQGSVADGKKADKEASHRPGGARFPGL